MSRDVAIARDTRLAQVTLAITAIDSAFGAIRASRVVDLARCAWLARERRQFVAELKAIAAL